MTADRKAVYLLAGGRSSVAGRGPDPLMQEALQQGAVISPSVAYIGAASNDNAGFRAMITRLLRKAGAKEVQLAPLCGRRADRRKAMRVIESCRIVFVSGGDVEAGMKVLAEQRMIEFLRSEYERGKPFFGTSAGSIMLAKSWVRWRDPDDDSSAELFPCLGIAEVYCDTHGEDSGWEELRVLARLVPAGTVSYGIASGTALVVNPDGSVHALGGDVHRFTRADDAVSRIRSLPSRSPAQLLYRP
jgi:cyanophycinase-like exopeptidase